MQTITMSSAGTGAILPLTGALDTPYRSLSFALYGVAIAAGGDAYGDPTYWVPAAVLVTVPMLVGAFRERRA